MKRLILFLLAITLAFSLFSCDKSEKGSSKTPPDTDPNNEMTSYSGKLFGSDVRFSLNGKHGVLSLTKSETLEKDGKLVSYVLILSATTNAVKDGNCYSLDLTVSDAAYIAILSAAGDGAEAFLTETKGEIIALAKSDDDIALINELFEKGSVAFYKDSALTSLLDWLVGYDVTLINDTQFRFDECRYADGSKIVWEYYESGNVKSEKRYRADGEVDYSNDFDDHSETAE